MAPDRNIRRYLGPTLIPQAGVAIGLLMVAGAILPEYAKAMNVVILSATSLYSVTGPSIAKASLVRAGEIELAKKEEKKCVKAHPSLKK